VAQWLGFLAAFGALAIAAAAGLALLAWQLPETKEIGLQEDQ
jgi:predicted MFS family arabinose efflux permease